MASAIALAFFKSHEQYGADHNPALLPSKKDTWIPVLNIPAADIQLRPEFMKVFEISGLSEDVIENHLVTLDDFIPPVSKSVIEWLSPEKTKWILVDQNTFGGKLGLYYQHRVFGVIDHHEDEQVVSQMALPRIIRKSGSCSSLVTIYCKDIWETITRSAISKCKDENTAMSDTDVKMMEGVKGREKSADSNRLEGSNQLNSDSLEFSTDNSRIAHRSDVVVSNQQLAKLLLAAITIDTSNLANKSKTEVADLEAYRYLKGITYQMSASTDGGVRDSFMTEFYEQIAQAKANMSKLNIREILQKDFKQFGGIDSSPIIGISSVGKSWKWLCRQDIALGISRTGNPMTDIALAMKEFAEARNLAIYVVMMNYVSSDTKSDAKKQRALCLCASDPAHAVILEQFEERYGKELKLEKPSLDEFYGELSEVSTARDIPPEDIDLYDEQKRPLRKYFQQKNRDMTRKAVMPMLKKIVSELGHPTPAT